MNRLSTLTLGLITLTWATGCCCHKYQSRCVDWDDGCCTGDIVDDCGQKQCGKRDRKCRDERCRNDRCRNNRRPDDNCCCPTDCCETGGATQTFAPTTGVYDSGAVMGGSGCSGCSGAMPMGAPTTGGCASGNCGTSMPMSMPTYGGMPIDPSSGWTISPAVPATGSEPTPAPPTGNSQTPATNSSSITPVPMPISPPVGAAR